MIYLKLSDLWKAKQTTPTEICAFFKPRCQDESHRVTMSSCRVTSCAECRDCLRSAAKHGSLRSWIPVGWFTKCNLSALAKQIPREKEHVQCFRVVYSGLEWFISIFSKFSQFQVVSMLVTSSHPMVFDRWTNLWRFPSRSTSFLRSLSSRPWRGRWGWCRTSWRLGRGWWNIKGSHQFL